MSAPDIPTNYNITQTINPMSIGTTLAGGMRTELAGGMQTELEGDIRTEMAGGISVTLLGDEKQPIATKMDVSMTMENLPKFEKQDIFDLIAAMKEMKTRVRMPIDLSFGLSVFPLNLFNINMLQFRICGEPQVIIDDYVPNAYERCDVVCEPCD